MLSCLLFSATFVAQAGASSDDLYRDAMIAITEGRMLDAEKHLELLLKEQPLHAGAYLDLALLYCSAGNNDAAERLFDVLEQRFAPPVQILEIIASQRTTGCLGRKVPGYASIRLSRGYESNVNQGASNPNFSIGSGLSTVDLVLLPEFQPKGDNFTSLSTDLSRELFSTGATGSLFFQSKQYDGMKAYSTNALFLGLEQPWHRWGWTGRGIVSIGQMTLGDKLYLKQNQFQIEVAPPLGLPANWQLSVASGLSRIIYPTLRTYDSEIFESRAALSYRRSNVQWQAFIGQQQDRQLAQRPGGNREGYIRGLTGKFVFSDNVFGELALQAQHWHGDDAYLPGFIDQKRVQDTVIARIAVTLKIDPNNLLSAEFRDVRNAENISIFDYRNRIFQLNWQWQAFN